jgi:transposase
MKKYTKSLKLEDSPADIPIERFYWGAEAWQKEEGRHSSSPFRATKGLNSNTTFAAPQCAPARHGVRASFCCGLMESRFQKWPAESESYGALSTSGSSASSKRESPVWRTSGVVGESLFFPPQVAVHLVKLACERPDKLGRSLSQWDCTELTRQLIAEGIVEDISASTVRRILVHHKLKPWRHHMWLSPKHPRDAEFYARVLDIIDLYTRPLGEDEIVLSVDEKTSLQPRPRLHPTMPAQPGLPNRVEHEYRRVGALNLFAAFDTRTGKVYGQCYDRKRQKEFIAFLEHVEARISDTIKTIHIVCDNVPTHHGKKVRAWLAKHPRFQFHFTPVHCSWMNQVEQWFSILQRKRFRMADFESKADLKTKLEQFIEEWNKVAHSFNWTKKSVAKVMAGAPRIAA